MTSFERFIQVVNSSYEFFLLFLRDLVKLNAPSTAITLLNKLS